MRARGGVLGRLAGRLAGSGRRVPAGAVVAVGGRDTVRTRGECSFVLLVGAAGPARLHYALTGPAGPVWLRLVPVGERGRRRVLRAVLGSGALAAAVPPGARAVAGAAARSGARAGGDSMNGESPFGWLHVATENRSVWLDLPADGRVGGVAVRALVVGLVPAAVWRELGLLRGEVWDQWAEGSDRGAWLDRTRPDDWPGPDDWAGPGRSGDQGWPGIRRGGGLGGVW